MENNFPLSAQIGIFPERLKEEAGIIYVLVCVVSRLIILIATTTSYFVYYI